MRVHIQEHIAQYFPEEEPVVLEEIVVPEEEPQKLEEEEIDGTINYFLYGVCKTTLTRVCR